MEDSKVSDVDLYELLDLSIECSVQDVKRAYRKKALQCHPDKNPDNPKAAELFHQLSKALEVLTDDAARAVYDKVLKAKKAAKLRHRELDARRKKLKEDLEERERMSTKASAADMKTDEEKLQAEIERLRKEGSKQLAEEVEYVRRQVEREKETREDEKGGSQNRLTLRWRVDQDSAGTNGGYTYEALHTMLSKYGDIVALVVLPKKKGRALVEFESRHSAQAAQQLEKGLPSNPLTISWLDNGSSAAATPRRAHHHKGGEAEKGGIFPSVVSDPREKSQAQFCNFSFPQGAQEECPNAADADFESVVLQRLRQAEERKRLVSEMKDSE